MPAAGSTQHRAPVPGLPPGWRLETFDAVGSTNEVARTRAVDGAPAGLVVWAREQTVGRARRGRGWASPPGNLYCSALLRPDCAPSAAGQISFVVAVAMAEAVRAVAPGLDGLCLKWPNDLVVHRRKLAGILLESALTPAGAVEWVVIGTGVNIASHPAAMAYPATDLAAEGVGDLAPAVLLEQYVAALDRWLGRWREGGFDPVRDAWLEAATGLGETIAVRLDRETVTGRFETLDRDGALHLALDDGGRRRFTAGDVFFGDS